MTTVSQPNSTHNPPQPLSIGAIVDRVGGELKPLFAAEMAGQADFAVSSILGTPICGAAPPQEAEPGFVTMVDEVAHAAAIGGTQAALLITPQPLTPAQVGQRGPAWQIVVADPHAAFTKLILHFRPPMGNDVPGAGVDSTARVHPSAQISSAASIGAGVTIGPGCKIHAGVTVGAGCQIGSDCVLYPNVTLYSYTQLGDRVTLHAGTVIGAHGFGYHNVNGRHVPTAQLGYVKIENDVEVGAAVTIDRGTYGATLIGEGTKIDNQVMIAHNCRIGRHNLLCSQVGIAGSCTTGDYVVMAGQVGLKDHVHLGDGVVVCAQSGVMEDLSKGVYLGSPATTQREQLQIMAVQRRLPEIRRDLRNLQREMEEWHSRDEMQGDGETSSKAA